MTEKEKEDKYIIDNIQKNWGKTDGLKRILHGDKYDPEIHNKEKFKRISMEQGDMEAFIFTAQFGNDS